MRGPGDRASKRHFRKEPTSSSVTEGHGAAALDAEKAAALPRGRKSLARAHTPQAREPGDLGGASSQPLGDTQLREGEIHKPQSQASEESDAFVVPTCKKSAKTWVTPVESMEGRSAAKRSHVVETSIGLSATKSKATKATEAGALAPAGTSAS